MNNKNFVELTLTNNPLKESYIFPKYLAEKPGSPTFEYISLSCISDELACQLSQVDLKILGAVIFKKPPKVKNSLHKDLAFINKKWEVWHCAINWNLFNSESRMSWYSTTQKEIWPDSIETTEPYFLSGVHYSFPWNKITNVSSVTLLETTRLKTPSLVRTDIPHQIENFDNVDRWCLSVRFDHNYTMDQLIKKLEPFILQV